jgi:hypothetical protein
MKAKLIKQNGIGIQTIDGADYYLILDGKTYHTNPLTSDLSNGGKLSKQNCDEIFEVVDVNKLANYEYPEGDDWSPEESLVRKLAFLNGFNKAMGLNKDKLFTVEDMEKVILNAIEFTDFQKDQVRKGNYYHIALDIIQPLQQPTEIDVEIEMVFLGFEMESGLKMEEPKLDSNGNLILRKL